MTSFIARCPSCQTTFQVSPAQFAMADGLVRCGTCLNYFRAEAEAESGLEGLRRPAREQAEADQVRRAAQEETDLRLHAEESRRRRDALLGLREEPALPAVDPNSLDALVDPDSQELPGRPRHRRGLWLLASFLLAALLGLQLLWGNAWRFAGDARWYPLLAHFCAFSACDLPPFRDLAAIRSDDLLIRSHPQRPEALEVTLVFRNHAALAQDFPLLELSFSDLNGRPVASRRFTPSEYLPVGLRDFEQLPPARPVQVDLVIADPGDSAVNYALNFR